MNFLNFYASENVYILLFFLEDYFAGYRILVYWAFLLAL